uniref:Uncharacterized protein n=1 Tax=Arundo donax TaxID=35708 RepID=A0A0A9BB30_ARUDO
MKMTNSLLIGVSFNCHLPFLLP